MRNLDFNTEFKSSKKDIQYAWDLSDSDKRLSGDWIYGVDPETMFFAKACYKRMPGEYSLYTTFVYIMKCNDVNKLRNIINI